jgi:hypothetical protein
MTNDHESKISRITMASFQDLEKQLFKSIKDSDEFIRKAKARYQELLGDGDASFKAICDQYTRGVILLQQRHQEVHRDFSAIKDKLRNQDNANLELERTLNARRDELDEAVVICNAKVISNENLSAKVCHIPFDDLRIFPSTFLLSGM